MGSEIYEDPNSLDTLASAIRNEMKRLNRRLSDRWKTRRFTDLLKIVNLQQLGFYLHFQIATVARPLRPRTQYATNRFGSWVSDKNSALYRERKFVPFFYGVSAGGSNKLQQLSSMLLQQSNEVSNAIRELTELAGTLGIGFSSEITGTQHILPVWVSWDKKTNVLKAERMREKVLGKCLETFGFEKHYPQARNVIRHMGSTRLSCWLNDAIVNEAMGHEHPGMDYFGKESSGSVQGYQAVAKRINQWVTTIELVVYKIDPDGFKGDYDLG
jgi:hypothetical protein